ncbi:hypothetical protein BSPWISOXPB_10366 [uncultured Gammaproteobacteria bacterium]|nr:hypothetical protein BSPWISOXPB_10366 [uncultured Gammaproteobacteria bacterium]
MYIYVGNNPLKYIDQTGQVKVYPMDGGEPHELDVLSPIEGTYRSDNLFDFPESYERLEEIVKTYPANKLDLLNANTKFTIKSEGRKGALTIRALSLPPSTSEFENIMDFNTGQLTFESNFRDKNCISGLNATEVTSYQYLGMTKIAGALNMLPKTFLREGISNPSTKKAIEIYRADGNYPKFYRNFVGSSDNGRSSLRIANTFSLEIVSIKMSSSTTLFQFEHLNQ